MNHPKADREALERIDNKLDQGDEVDRFANSTDSVRLGAASAYVLPGLQGRSSRAWL